MTLKASDILLGKTINQDLAHRVVKYTEGHKNSGRIDALVKAEAKRMRKAQRNLKGATK